MERQETLSTLGLRRLFREDGSLLCEGPYEGRKRRGEWNYYDRKTRKKYATERYLDDDGNVSVIVFDKEGRPKNEYTKHHDVFEGLYKIYHADGCTPAQEITFVNGVAHGPLRAYYESGALQIAQVQEQGVQQGLIRNYYPGGQLSSAGYKKDLEPDGVALFYRENGHLSLVTFAEGGNQIPHLPGYLLGVLVEAEYEDNRAMMDLPQEERLQLQLAIVEREMERWEEMNEFLWHSRLQQQPG